MLMIILGILKVIGILFLILFGIILLLILLLLFCPVRYVGAAEKAEGQQLRASGDITWLLHLLHLRVTVEGTQPAVSVRILGISSEGFGRFVSAFRRKPKPSKTDTDKTTEKNVEKVNRAASGNGEITAESNTSAPKTKTEKITDGKECSAVNEETIYADDANCSTEETKEVFVQDKDCPSKSVAEVMEDDEKCFTDGKTLADIRKKTDESDKKDFSDKTEKTIKDKENTDKNSTAQNKKASVFDKLYSTAGKIIKQIISVSRKILGILKKIFHLPERIAKGINKGISQGKAVAKNISDLKVFVSSQEFEEAMTFGLGRMMRFLHHLRPKKLTGDVEFGFSDPADTGMALAVIAPFFPYYADHLQVVPDFQEKKLSFSLNFKGRIYGCMLLYIAVQILLDRNIRIVIGKIRKRRSE